jgi:hypothetical protein
VPYTLITSLLSIMKKIKIHTHNPYPIMYNIALLGVRRLLDPNSFILKVLRVSFLEHTGDPRIIILKEKRVITLK